LKAVLAHYQAAGVDIPIPSRASAEDPEGM